MISPPILPGATIGIVGGGQLGRMLALEARRMGYRTVSLDPKADGPAAQVTDGHIAAPLEDPEALRELARRADVVTWEWENVDAAAAEALETETPLRPAPRVLGIAQDRVREKDAIRELGIPVAPYRRVTDLPSLERALREIGTPALLKATRGGYDGRGQARIAAPGDAPAALALLAEAGQEWIVEGWVAYEREISVVCARSPLGEVSAFPVAENVHVEGILDTTACPAQVSDAVRREALAVAEALVEGLGVIGVLAVEMFVEGGRVLVNEIAPRPHNSGHFTWEACTVSQFEQQLRAVCGLPLGSTELLRPAAMANLLGRHLGEGQVLDFGAALSDPTVALHLYGKDGLRPRRKMGHLTALGASAGEALETVLRARLLLASSA